MSKLKQMEKLEGLRKRLEEYDEIEEEWDKQIDVIFSLQNDDQVRKVSIGSDSNNSCDIEISNKELIGMLELRKSILREGLNRTEDDVADCYRKLLNKSSDSFWGRLMCALSLHKWEDEPRKHKSDLRVRSVDQLCSRCGAKSTVKVEWGGGEYRVSRK